jgi:hypothetical protein
MVNKKILAGMFSMVLALGTVLVGCSTDSDSEETDTWTLKESLGKYMAPSEQNWGEEDGTVNVYFLDHAQFATFKSELDAGGEYSQNDTETETRDWETGKNFARLGVKADGTIRLDRCNADNSFLWYRYEKVSATAGRQKLDASLRKYVGAQPQRWSHNVDGGEVDDDADTYVYFLDTAHFEDFRSELNANWVEYFQFDSWTDADRDWEQGKSFARWAERPDGIFELDLCNSDNSRIGYRYKKVPQVNASWDEQWDEGTITLTYLGLNKPSDFVLNDTHDGSGEYKGYYKFYYQTGQGDGGTHRTRYVYYPTSGRKDVQFSNWLD